VTVPADAADRADTTPVEAESESAAEYAEQRRRVLRRRGFAFAFAALVICAIVMLWPVWAAPLGADQRYMYLYAAGTVQGDWFDIIGIPWSDITSRAEQGRVTPVGFIVQWFFYTVIMELSVATGTPVVVLHGIQKLMLLGLCVLCVAAFVKSLRGRGGPDGQLVQLSRSTVWLVVAAVVVLAAVGAQTHFQFRNGWLSYPVLTYGAVIVGFGVPALALWLTRLLAERPHPFRIALAIVAMLTTGVFLNVSYELYYAAFPAALLALVLQPTPEGERRRARAAKVATGGVLTLAFLVTFVTIRIWTASACEDECYVGTDAQVGGETVLTAWYNVASSLPLSGRTEALAGLSNLSQDSLARPFSSLLTIACVIAGLALVAARILLQGTSGSGETASTTRRDAAEQRAHASAESGALARGAVVALVLALGSAAVMSVSAQAPEIVLGIGYPYRHIVVTWVGLCVAGVLALLAIDLRVRNRLGVALWGATAATAVLLAGVMLPINLQMTRAENLSGPVSVPETIHREVTLGDPRPEADERRCATLAALAENGVPPTTEQFITRSVQRAYEHFYGVAYCSDPPASDASDR